MRKCKKYTEFVQTMADFYGLGEQYAGAAFLTLCERDRTSNVGGADLAHNYCRRFRIAKVA